MKKHLRVFAIVVSILAIGCGTASAYDKNTQSVLLDMDGVPRMVTTDKTTVGELMDDLAENVETEYIVTNAEESDVLEDNMELTLTSVTEKTVSTTKTVPYETVERTNNNLKSGTGRCQRHRNCYQQRNLSRHRTGRNRFRRRKGCYRTRR